jgi:hypothetical protein
MVEQVLHLEVVRRCGEASPIDLIDGLAAALKFSRRDTHDWTGRTLAFLAGLRGAKSPSYAQHALAEADCRNRRARHIVYGHTHQHEIVPLDASHADGYVLSQTYFNAGTWRRSFQPTQTIAGHTAGCQRQLSVLTFYQSDNGGRALKRGPARCPNDNDIAAKHRAASRCPHRCGAVPQRRGLPLHGSGVLAGLRTGSDR